MFKGKAESPFDAPWDMSLAPPCPKNSTSKAGSIINRSMLSLSPNVLMVIAYLGEAIFSQYELVCLFFKSQEYIYKNQFFMLRS